MARYAALPAHVREALSRIQPSHDGELPYYPCRVALNNGEVIDTVYIEAEEPYFSAWGVYPENDSGKKWIRVEDVAKVEDSPTRLPAQFANTLYSHGESGMGYTIFTVVFNDGQRQAYGTGNALDFIRYPPGKGPEDVSAVIPHEGRQDPNLVSSPDWYWCLYSEQDNEPER
jgi:hypothetical protein